MNTAPQTHNRHLDTARAMVAASAYPTPLDPHDLTCILTMAETARQLMAEAYKLAKPDWSLGLHVETAGKSCKTLIESVSKRMERAVQ